MSRSSVDSFLTILSNDKVIEALTKIFESIVHEAVAVQFIELTTKLDEVAADIKLRDETIAKLNTENERLRKQIEQQANEVEQLEAYNRQDNLIIHGIPLQFAEVAQNNMATPTAAASGVTENSTTTEQSFLQLCHDLELDVGPRDISACHRLKKKPDGAPPPIIVRFVSRKVRAAVLGARNKLRVRNSDPSRPSRVYINEHLTVVASNIFAAARSLVNHKQIKQAWSFSGRIYIRTLDDNVKLITKKADLDTI